MNQQFSNPFFAFSKQFADNAFKAQSLALKSLESITDLQLKSFEHQAKVSSAFVAEVMEIRDLSGVRGLWEKGTSLSRDSAEHGVAVTQEIVAITQKAAESMTALAQEQRQAVTDAASAPIAAAKNAASK